MSTSKAGIRTRIDASADQSAWSVKLVLILAAGAVLRALFIGNEGFKNDIGSFEAWAITLASHPLSQFYRSTSFADYPPGYFYVLWAIGHAYAPFAAHGSGYGLLKVLVKLPAILMDLFDGVMLYAIVRRFAEERWALGAAAFFVLNPATIFISAAWGQVDSIAGGFALLAVYLLLVSDDLPSEKFNWPIAGAWLSLAYSILIKPPAAILVPLLLVFTFVSAARRGSRTRATAIGILAALALALAVALPFHPTLNPIGALVWLFQKYSFGKNVYPFNSVNAFNLWTIKYQFWQNDSQKILFFPQYLWGVILLLAATALIVVRYAQARTSQALIESALLLGLAFYMLSTRMHERYIFDGLLFTIAAIPFGRRYLWSAVILSLTLFANLLYSLHYLTVVTQSIPGVNAADMYPALTHPLSLLNVILFFYLGYVYLGSGESAYNSASAAALRSARIGVTAPAEIPAARGWFDPREGLQRMLWPLDYIVAGALGVFSFVLSFINYWTPGEKIFDEIYFARAAEEYLGHRYIYESTHPPLTKLIITLSTMLFGGLHGGDNAHGWRFLDVLCGAIVVVVLYAFAKRITRSTLFAGLAALMLTFDGMHFVQSRIATPEGIVIVFSTSALYAFYRFWIASQSTERAFEPGRTPRVAISFAGALAAGFATSALVCLPTHQSKASLVVLALYLSAGFYLLLRAYVLPKILGTAGRFVTYPEGSFAVRDGERVRLHSADGGLLDSTRKTPVLGALTRGDRGALFLAGPEFTVTYTRDGSVGYETPAGKATYTPGHILTDAGETQEGRHATGWLIAFTVLLGMLVASKWYGVMAYGVSFTVVAGVWAQRYLLPRKLKVWGNPFGFRLDVTLAVIVFLSASVYAMAWIPDGVRHISGEVQSLDDLVTRQVNMFEYHDHLNDGGRNQHPYASAWWEWPLDLRPVAYYWKDLRTGVNANNPAACCVREITTLPNPLILWFGLFCVPFVGVLAYRERNKGYALIVLAYLLQWLPWMRSPRITFAYHFYVDIPLIVLCNVIVLQRLWHWGDFNADARLFSRIGVGAYVAAVAIAFFWFYPILAGVPLPWSQWDARMWHALMGNAWI